MKMHTHSIFCVCANSLNFLGSRYLIFFFTRPVSWHAACINIGVSTNKCYNKRSVTCNYYKMVIRLDISKNKEGDFIMYNILLVCSAGMSTSLLVTKMDAAAKAKNVEVKIAAVAEADLQKSIDGVNIVLLGPQVRYLLSKIQKLVSPMGIPVEVINSIDYGTMNGEKVLNRAIELIQ